MEELLNQIESLLDDLEKDPDELINMYQKPEYRETVKKLAQELLVYGKKYNDPRINVPHIRNELEQAIKSEAK